MSNRISLEAVPSMPYIHEGDNVGEVLVTTAKAEGFSFEEGDVLCVASKAVSLAEGRLVALDTVTVGDTAQKLHARIPRKDPRTLQLIIDATGTADLSRLDLNDNYIAGWLPNGNRLTSAGVDKMGPEHVILLPEDPDESASAIGATILESTGINVAVIITDSDGRVEKRGATQVAIGVYGIPPVRVTEHKEKGEVKINEETTCDMLAASAGLIMGQRGTNKPVVLIRGHEYEFDKTATIADALVQSNSLGSTLEKPNE
jgi:coenzyme F420-0:L-glutamate ligase / coenzyme F420-1:gamma-L-glutamate ligase